MEHFGAGGQPGRDSPMGPGSPGRHRAPGGRCSEHREAGECQRQRGLLTTGKEGGAARLFLPSAPRFHDTEVRSPPGHGRALRAGLSSVGAQTLDKSLTNELGM